MKMVRNISAAVLLAAAIAGGTPAAAAQEAAASSGEIDQPRLVLARQIIDIGAPEAMREEMFFSAVDQMTLQIRDSMLNAGGPIDEGAMGIVDEWLAGWIEEGKGVLRSHIPALMEGWTLAYADMFTAQELEDILAFVSTPSGQNFFQRSSQIVSNPHFAAANQAYMDETMAQLPLAQARLMAELEAYFNESEEPE